MDAGTEKGRISSPFPSSQHSVQIFRCQPNSVAALLPEFCAGINRDFLTRTGDQREEFSCPVRTTEPKRKKNNSSFFLAGIQTKKSQTLFAYYGPPNFLFLSMKASSFPCAGGPACGLWLQTQNCSSLLILNKPIFAGEIPGSAFVLGQHFLWLIFRNDHIRVFCLKFDRDEECKH